MIKLTHEWRCRLDLSMAEYVEIQVLLEAYRETLVQLLSDPDALLEDLSPAFEADRVKRLEKAEALLSGPDTYCVDPEEAA